MGNFFSSCEDDENDVKLPEYGDAEFVSFGFYAEDNPGNLLNDYVVDNITGDISVALPQYVDKTSLVARFEVTDDDTVFVNGVIQESGVSANDFTTPVDYLVTEGTSNSLYTVTIEDLPDAVWTPLASDTTDMRETVMKVNPVTGIPYIAYVQSADDSDNYKAGVLMLDGTQLTILGGSTLSEARASDVNLAFDADGIPYVVFTDYSNENKSASVMSFTGSAWNYVGGSLGKGITDTEIGYNDLVLLSDNNPMLVAVNDGRDGAIERRNLNISLYDGSAWQTSITIPGRPTTNTYYPKACRYGNSVIVGVLNVSESTFSVYKYTDGSWTTISEGYSDERATGIYYRDFDMDVDASGNIYVALADNILGEDIVRPRVIKYNEETSSWDDLGSPINVDGTVGREFSLAISPAGIPCMLYRDENMYPVMVAFDETTQDWSNPDVLENVESESLYLDFAPNGVGYAIFTNTSLENTMLYKYDIPQE